MIDVGFRTGVDHKHFHGLFPRSRKCLPSESSSVVQVKYTNRRGRKASRKATFPHGFVAVMYVFDLGTGINSFLPASVVHEGR